MTTESSGAQNPMRYFLYIPVWATTQQPQGSSGGSSDNSSAASSGSEYSSSNSERSSSGSQSGRSSGDSGSGGGTDGSGGGSGGGSGSGGSGSGDGSGGGGGGGGGGSGGGSGGGGGGGGGGGSGGGGSGGNCFVYGTLVVLADGREVPIEQLAPGMEVASLRIPDLVPDANYDAQYAWLTDAGLGSCERRSVAIDRVRKGEHDGYYVINGRVQATFEHPFLVRREGQWGFASANLLEIGDLLVLPDLREERVSSIDARPGLVRTVSIHVPGTNTYIAGGVWVHNALSLDTMGSSANTLDTGGTMETSGSNSGSGKSGGSSWNTADTAGTEQSASQMSGGEEIPGGKG